MSDAVLVRAPNWVGDQILSYPFFYHLRKAYPRAWITSVCVPWVEEIQFRDLVNEVVVIDTRSSDPWLDRLVKIKKIGNEIKKKRAYSLGISLPNSWSAAWLLFSAGAVIRRGYGFEGRSILLNEPISWKTGSPMHRARAYLQLLGQNAPALEKDFAFELSQFKAEKNWNIDLPENILSTLKSVGPYWVLGPGATAESRRWFETRFLELSEQIYKETKWVGVLVGGAKEAALCQRLKENSHAKLIDLSGKLKITQLWSVLKNAKFTVCNESGLSHVAAFCGSPTQIICGAADPQRTRPIGPGDVQVIFNPIECWPCEQNTCSRALSEQFLCLKGIETPNVWNEIKNRYLKDL